MSEKKITSTDKEAKLRIEKYNQVVEKARLQSVSMTNVVFGVKPTFFEENGKKSLSYDIELVNAVYEPEEAAAMAFVTFKVDAKNGRAKGLVCKAEYIVAYDNLEDCDEEAVKVFLRRVGSFTIYPYFRSLFANLDWAANTSLPPLPIHKEPIRQKAIAS